VPITIIPAQPRGSTRTWSPEVLIQQQQQQAQQQRRALDRSPTAAGALPSDEPATPADLSNSTTLTSNSLPAAEAASRNSNTPRTNDAGTSVSPVVIQSPRRNLITTNSFSRQVDPPPRADDISPSAGSTGTVTIVPAPRRSPLRAITTTPPTLRDAASNSAATAGDELSPGGHTTQQRHSPLRHHTTPPAGTQ
jgi:hypothetical protein